MNELRVFSNAEFGDVRTVIIDGCIQFVGADIAKALGYGEPHKAVARHCKHGTKHPVGVVTGLKADGSSIVQMIDMVVVPEGDMYRLIVKAAAQSNSQAIRENAERFESWIFDEVLPTLRQTGTYTIQPKQDSYMIDDPIKRAQRWIEEQEEKEKLAEKVNELAPKADYFDNLVDSKLLTNFRDTAKELGYSQTEFTGWLLTKGYVYKDSKGIIKPYEPYRKQGLFEMKDFKNPYNGFSGARTYVTVKGKNTFRLLMQVPDKARD